MPFGSPQWMYASGGDAFTIDQSLRINDGDSPSLARTPTSDGNRRTWTYSCWFKPSLTTSGETFLWGAYNGSGGFHDYIRYSNTSGGTMKWTIPNAANGDVEGALIANALFRDPSAWYHMVFALDTTLASATDRMRWYVNGEEITSFETDTNPAQNYQCTNINTQVVHAVGSRAYSVGTNSFDGYMAEVHFIDGLQLTPTSFGESGDYGEWKPIEVSGLTYGTNGFYLSFAGGGIMSATGGNSTATDGNYKAASFTADGTFTPSADGFVEYLVIGGGGGGGTNNGAGGGAGGYRTGYLQVTGNTAYSITVGAGGTGTGYATVANSGEASVFSTITAAGGGGGGGDAAGGNGGSGGGAYQHQFAAGSGNTPSTSPSQGNNGGAGSSGAGSGGGGGAGGVGGTGSTGGNGGDGGAGTSSSITGASVCRAGGGAGNGYGSAGSTTCGGGSGAVGTANTGGGGGSKGNVTAAGYTGGSGIVIIRYKFQ